MAMSFTTSNKSLHYFSAKTLDGSDFSFATLKGKKVLIVNTASECGYTPQYKDLQALWDKYKDKNFVVIGFPCNEFGGQEPGTASDIKTFCTKNYGVTFQMMEKVSVKGDNQCEIYKWLCNKSQNGVEDATVKWNFNKFLIDENGKYVKHLGSSVNPMDKEITDWIEAK
jgi:glutathione peroxidase